MLKKQVTGLSAASSKALVEQPFNWFEAAKDRIGLVIADVAFFGETAHIFCMVISIESPSKQQASWFSSASLPYEFHQNSYYKRLFELLA